MMALGEQKVKTGKRFRCNCRKKNKSHSANDEGKIAVIVNICECMHCTVDEDKTIVLNLKIFACSFFCEFCHLTETGSQVLRMTDDL